MQSYNENVPAGQSMPWYTVWTEVITHPSRDTFRRILADPTASPNRAYIWVAVLSFIFGSLQAVFYQVTGVSPLGNARPVSPAVLLLCGAILAPLFAVIGLALGTAILHGIAKLLGGIGTYNPLVYCLGAAQAPMSIASYLLTFITLVLSRGGTTGSLASLCVVPFSLAVGIYAIVLQVLAVDEVEKIGTGKAVLTVLIPTIILLLIVGCIVAFILIATARQLPQ